MVISWFTRVFIALRSLGMSNNRTFEEYQRAFISYADEDGKIDLKLIKTIFEEVERGEWG